MSNVTVVRERAEVHHCGPPTTERPAATSLMWSVHIVSRCQTGSSTCRFWKPAAGKSTKRVEFSLWMARPWAGEKICNFPRCGVVLRKHRRPCGVAPSIAPSVFHGRVSAEVILK